MSSEIRYFDTHAHYNLRDFSEDLPEVTERIRAAGVQRDAVIGIDLPSSERAVELAKIAWTSTGNDNVQAVMQAGTRSE